MTCPWCGAVGPDGHPAYCPNYGAVTVTCGLQVGQVWVDPEDVSWRLAALDDGHGKLVFSRVATTSEGAIEVVRTWRRVRGEGGLEWPPENT